MPRLCRPLGKGGERRLVWLPYALIGRLTSLSLFFSKVHDSSRKAKEALAPGQRRNIQPDAADMISELASTMREDAIISHLIRIYAASGTISERISALIEAESATWGEKMEPDLLR